MAFKVKILVLLNVAIFFGCASINNNKKAGEIVDEKFIITADIQNIKNEWNKILIENKINGELSNFEIRKDYDTNEESKEYYFLIGFSSDKIVKVATIVLKKKDVFYFSNIKEQRIAICHGTTDCMPKKFKKDHWGCDCDMNNLFDCKKTEVIIFK